MNDHMGDHRRRSVRVDGAVYRCVIASGSCGSGAASLQVLSAAILGADVSPKRGRVPPVKRHLFGETTNRRRRQRNTVGNSEAPWKKALRDCP